MNNSFVTIANNLIDLNSNNIKVLQGLEEVVSSESSTVEIRVQLQNGQTQSVNLPTVGFLQSEIDRLNRNLESLSSIQGSSFIQEQGNRFQRIVVSDLNKEPNPIPELTQVESFTSKRNWFFDALLNPMLTVEFDLSQSIQDDVKQILSRRYIVSFEQNAQGDLTEAGENARDSFTQDFIGRTNIQADELEDWINNTPGVRPNRAGRKVEYDEQVFNLEANNLQFDGLFTVLGVDEIPEERRLWYLLDTLDYYDVVTRERSQLKIDDEVIINSNFSSSRFKVLEVSTTADQFRVRFERVQGYDAIPVGVTQGLKYYSQPRNEKKVRISIGFDEYNILFVKPINTENNLLAREWSSGVAFYTNDLTLSSDEGLGINGLPMNEYYIQQVRDYGRIIQDLVAKSIPEREGLVPNATELLVENFTVLQSNRNITDNADSETLRNLNSQSNTLRSQLDELNKTLDQKKQELSRRNFSNAADRTKLENEIQKITTRNSNVSEQLNSIVNQITSQEQLVSDAEPEFRVRGFWPIPDPITNGKTRPQEVIQFKVQYRYLSTSGQENPIESFNYTNPDGSVVNASLSNWQTYMSDVRRRVYDVSSQQYIWQEEDVSNPDQVNINQADIPITPNSQVQIRVKSISEVGWPTNRIESEWSNIATIGFPEDLIPEQNQRERIRREAELENVRLTVTSDLNSRGLNDHLSGSFRTANDRFYAHQAGQIAVQNGSEFLSLDEKLRILESNENIQEPRGLELESGWVNYGSGFGPAEFYKHEGRVYLSGYIRLERIFEDRIRNRDFEERYPNLVVRTEEPAQNQEFSNIALLPVGFRPSYRKVFMVPCSLADEDNSGSGILSYPWGNNRSTNMDLIYARLDVYPNGVVKLYSGSTGWLSLDQVNFRVPSNALDQVDQEANRQILQNNQQL